MTTPDSPLTRELLEHQAFLRRLAQGLVGEDADDLVQDVWTRALASPPEDTRSIRAWAARVARSIASNRHRSRAHQAEREERVARAEAHPPEHDEYTKLEERFALQRTLITVVNELEEPYRRTILERYFEELSHTEIARRRAAPVATVRTQLRRALEQLREKLDRRHGDRERWLPGVALFATERGGSVPTTAGSIGIGRLAVAPFAYAGAAVLLVAAGLVLSLRVQSSESPSRTREASVSLGAPAVAGARDPESRAASARSATTRSAALRTAPGTVQDSGSAQVLVRGTIEGLSADEAIETRIRATGISEDPQWEGPEVEGTARADGTFELFVDALFEHRRGQVSMPGRRSSGSIRELLLHFDHPLHRRVKAQIPVSGGTRDDQGRLTFETKVTLFDAGVVRGRLFAADGSPAAGGTVTSFRLAGGMPVEKPDETFDCGEDGTFDLRLRPSVRHVLVCQLAESRPTTLSAAVDAGLVRDEGRVVLEEGLVISGQAMRQGVPVVGAGVGIRLLDPAPEYRPVHGGARLSWYGGHFERGGLGVKTDEDASFLFSGLAPADYELGVTSLPDCGLHLGGNKSYLTARAPAVNVLVEFNWTTLHFGFAGERDPGLRGVIRLEGERLSGAGFQGNVDEYVMVVPPNERFQGTVHFPGKRIVPFDVRSPESGGRLRVPIAFVSGDDTATLALEVSGSHASSIDEVTVGLYRDEERHRLAYEQTANVRDSLALFDDLPPGTYHAVARVGPELRHSSHHFQVSTFEVDLATGQQTGRCAIFELGARLRLFARDQHGLPISPRFRLLDSAGAEVPLQVIVHSEHGRASTNWELFTHGVNESEWPLPAGSYTLELWLEGHEDLRIPLDLVAGETTDLEIAMRKL